MYYKELENQFNYIRYGISRPRKCDLSSYITLDKKEERVTVQNTHITTDKSRSQMRE